MLSVTSPTGLQCVHMTYMERQLDKQTDETTRIEWRLSQHVCRSFDSVFSLWPKTTEKHDFSTCVRDRRTDGWMDRRTDRWTNQWTDLIEMCSLQTHIKTRRIVTVMFMFRISCSCRCSICQFGSSQTYLDSNTNSDSGSDLHCDLNDSYQFVKQESGFGYIYSIRLKVTLCCLNIFQSTHYT